MEKILICTKNEGKLIEIRDLLNDLKAQILSLNDLSTDSDVEETDGTYEKNAVLKAETYGKIADVTSLADDTGLEVTALNGMPGVNSKRFFKSSHEERNKELLNLLKNNPNRSAKFVDAVAVFNPQTGKTQVFMGKLAGTIVETKGSTHKDLGYDSIFRIDEIGKTFGEATLREKNSISHQAIAVNKAKEYLKTILKEG